MNDEELERLLQDELDGVADPGALRRLRERLEGSETARARRWELEAVFRALAQVPDEDAPAELREDVMAAIAERERTGPERAGRRARVGGFRPRPALAWGLPFLAGAVAGGLVIALVTGNLGPRARTDLPVAGSMAAPEAGGERVDARTLVRADARIALEVRRAGERVSVRFAPTRADGTELTLEYDGRALRPSGLEWDRPCDSQVTWGAGTVQVRVAGDARGTIALASARPGDAPLQVTLRDRAGEAQSLLHTMAVGPGR